MSDQPVEKLRTVDVLHNAEGGIIVRFYFYEREEPLVIRLFEGARWAEVLRAVVRFMKVLAE
jgi:hypothetical protein